MKTPSEILDSPDSSHWLKTVQETQRFAIFDVLVRNCGQVLTPDNVDRIMSEILVEMREGPCAWAFSNQDRKNEEN